MTLLVKLNSYMFRLSYGSHNQAVYFGNVKKKVNYLPVTVHLEVKTYGKNLVFSCSIRKRHDWKPVVSI